MNVKARLHRRQSRRRSDYLTAFVAGRRAAALLLSARRCPSIPPAHACTRRSTANPSLLRSNNGAGGRIIRTCPPNFNMSPCEIQHFRQEILAIHLIIHCCQHTSSHGMKSSSVSLMRNSSLFFCCKNDKLVQCSLAVLDPRVGHTMDILSPFIPVLCHSD